MTKSKKSKVKITLVAREKPQSKKKKCMLPCPLVEADGVAFFTTVKPLVLELNGVSMKKAGLALYEAFEEGLFTQKQVDKMAVEGYTHWMWGYNVREDGVPLVVLSNPQRLNGEGSYSRPAIYGDMPAWIHRLGGNVKSVFTDESLIVYSGHLGYLTIVLNND